MKRLPRNSIQCGTHQAGFAALPAGFCSKPLLISWTCFGYLLFTLIGMNRLGSASIAREFYSVGRNHSDPPQGSGSAVSLTISNIRPRHGVTGVIAEGFEWPAMCSHVSSCDVITSHVPIGRTGFDSRYQCIPVRYACELGTTSKATMTL